MIAEFIKDDIDYLKLIPSSATDLLRYLRKFDSIPLARKLIAMTEEHINKYLTNITDEELLVKIHSITK